jgi:hypothetical protein
MKLIGLSGEISCGKTTLCKILEKYNYQEYMLSKPLKDIAVILNFNQEQVFGNQEQKLQVNEFWGISSRQFLQVFGTEVCRDTLPNLLPNMKLNNKSIWLRLFEKYYNDNSDKNIVVSDIRYSDEAKVISDLGGILIRINRNKTNKVEQNINIHNHKSEQSFNEINYDFVIDNNGTIEELEENIKNIILKK